MVTSSSFSSAERISYEQSIRVGFPYDEEVIRGAEQQARRPEEKKRRKFRSVGAR
jgi:hypothetical protein